MKLWVIISGGDSNIAKGSNIQPSSLIISISCYTNARQVILNKKNVTTSQALINEQSAYSRYYFKRIISKPRFRRGEIILNLTWVLSQQSAFLLKFFLCQPPSKSTVSTHWQASLLLLGAFQILAGRKESLCTCSNKSNVK